MNPPIIWCAFCLVSIDASADHNGQFALVSSCCEHAAK